MLVRTRSRKGELAIRTALGAGWAAVARVVLAEGVVLGLIGGTAGVVVAYLALPFLLSLGAEDLPGIMSVSIDRTVLAVALATSVAATLLFALIPVFHFAVPKLRMASELGGRARSMTEGREAHRTRQSLVVVQVALALVLLIGCGLMIRSFVTLRGVDPGFRDPETVQTFQLTIPPVLVTDAEHSGDHDAGRTVRLQQNLLDRLMAVPGVEAVGFTSSNDGLPLDGDGRTGTIDIEGQASAAEGPRLKEMQAVSPGFFETMRTPLRAGRTFDWDDVHQRRAVVQVSESLARAEWGAVEAAVGKRIRTSADGPWLEVVGVVADVRHDGMNQPPPEVVISPAFARNTIASFVVRSPRVGTVGFVEDLHQAVWSVNGNLSLAGIRTIADMYEHSMARTAMTLKLLAITGALALLLGLVGIYGTVSYAVSERRREIGIRLALGARSGQVRRMFVRRALVLVGIGVAIGLGAASGLTRLMASQLFGVSPLDPATHAVVAALLVVATAAASYLSACRATSLDPASVLKGQ
jgi:predicted permease